MSFKCCNSEGQEFGVQNPQPFYLCEIFCNGNTEPILRNFRKAVGPLSRDWTGLGWATCIVPSPSSQSLLLWSYPNLIYNFFFFFGWVFKILTIFCQTCEGKNAKSCLSKYKCKHTNQRQKTPCTSSLTHCTFLMDLSYYCKFFLFFLFKLFLPRPQKGN